MEVSQVALDSPVEAEAVLVERGRGGLAVCWSNAMMLKGWLVLMIERVWRLMDGCGAREGTVAMACG